MFRLIKEIKHRNKLRKLHTAYLRALTKPTSPRRQALLKQEQSR